MNANRSLTVAALISFVGLILLHGGCEKAEPDPQSDPATSQVAPPEPISTTAENGPLKVTVTADRDRVRIPEQVKLTLRIEAEAGVGVKVPKLEGIVGEFAVAGVTESDPDCGEYVNCKEWIYTLDSFLPGVHEIPPLTFVFSDPREKADGSNEVYEDSVTTEPLAINVSQDLADVKGPMELPMPYRYRLLWWAIGAVAVMVLIALAVRWWRRRGVRPRGLPLATHVPAHVWALGELDRLAGEDLIGRGLVQEFYYRLNGLVRRYIELRFALMAGEQTSEEFIRAVQHTGALGDEHKGMLREFVTACDPVKYAGHEPQADEIDWVQAAARRFVLQTAADQAGANGRPPRLRATEEVVA